MIVVMMVVKGDNSDDGDDGDDNGNNDDGDDRYYDAKDLTRTSK